MNAKQIIDRLKQMHGDAIVSVEAETLDPSVEIKPESLLEVCRTLRDDPELNMNMLNLISGVDYFEPNEKKAAKVDWEPHLEVLYHLTSIAPSNVASEHRLVVRVKLPRWAEDKEGELPELASVSGLWPTADWHEREVYDLMGIRFTNHPDMRRILCPEDWEGHPLRKDYVTPDEYQGIKVK